MEGADWSELLPELLVLIGKTVNFVDELVVFAGVCSSWQSAAVECMRQSPRSCRFPCLMLAEAEEAEHNSEVRDFFLPVPTNVPGNIIKRVLPESCNKRCLSSQGWLLTIEIYDCYPNLLHPFSGAQIQLPKLSTFPGFYSERNSNFLYIQKAVLSCSDPLSPNFLIMVLFDFKGKLGYCRPGDTCWTVAEDSPDFGFFDIVYHNGIVYALSTEAEIFVYDVHGPNPTQMRSVFSFPQDFVPFIHMLYLVKSESGDDKFFLVSREGMWDKEEDPVDDGHAEDEDEDEYEDESGSDEENEEEETVEDIETTSVVEDVQEDFDEGPPEDIFYRSKKFRVFQFTLADKSKWVEVKDLGGDTALFVGASSSFAIKTNVGGCIKPDCIYFTDDCYDRFLLTRKGGGKDMGIYHLRDGTTEPHFEMWESRSLLTPPIWVFDQTSV